MMIDDQEFVRYVDLLMSMALDYKMGGISRGVFQSNLRRLAQEMAPVMCNCGKCMGTDIEACYKEQDEQG